MSAEGNLAYIGYLERADKSTWSSQDVYNMIKWAKMGAIVESAIREGKESKCEYGDRAGYHSIKELISNHMGDFHD